MSLVQQLLQPGSVQFDKECTGRADGRTGNFERRVLSEAPIDFVMPGYRLIFGTIALLIGIYGLIALPNASQGIRTGRFDQPENVQRLIAQAYGNPSPEDRLIISQELERELIASLDNPSAYFGR